MKFHLIALRRSFLSSLAAAAACLSTPALGEAKTACHEHPITASATVLPPIKHEAGYKAEVDYSLTLQASIFNKAPAIIDGYSHGGVLSDGSAFSFTFHHTPQGPVIGPVAIVCPVSSLQKAKSAERNSIVDTSSTALPTGRTIVAPDIGTIKAVLDPTGSRTVIYLLNGSENSRIAELNLKADVMSVQPGSTTDLFALDLFGLQEGKIQWTHVRFLRLTVK